MLPTHLPTPRFVLLLLGPVISAVACTSSIAPDNELNSVRLGELAIPLTVTVADSLHLACPADAPRASAHHWILSESVVRLEPDGTADLSFLAADVPPSKAGSPRCGGEGVRRGVRRPGNYRVNVDNVVIFWWDRIPEPDTAGVWVTSEDAWIGQAAPIGGQRLSAPILFHGADTRATLGFPVEPSG